MQKQIHDPTNFEIKFNNFNYQRAIVNKHLSFSNICFYFPFLQHRYNLETMLMMMKNNDFDNYDMTMVTMVTLVTMMPLATMVTMTNMLTILTIMCIAASLNWKLEVI